MNLSRIQAMKRGEGQAEKCQHARHHLKTSRSSLSVRPDGQFIYSNLKHEFKTEVGALESSRPLNSPQKKKQSDRLKLIITMLITIIEKGPVPANYTFAGVCDNRVNATNSKSVRLKGFVVLVAGFSTILWRVEQKWKNGGFKKDWETYLKEKSKSESIMACYSIQRNYNCEVASQLNC
ncbi:10560_t:CDS:2, partial [Dentiscutata erythropus]